ncbi:hypothetical protein [Nitrosopumilus sp.]|uniref:hypothetical protein n=1 Tax=Nitrosopumilus sp. TaxID=2024843 RepID=UPI00349FD729
MQYMENQWSRLQIIKGIKKMIPEITFIKKSENFDCTKGGIWTSGDNAWIYKGLPPFDHSVEFGECIMDGVKVKTMYANGIHKDIYIWLAQRGWYPKWYDPGTLFFWKYNITGFGI